MVKLSAKEETLFYIDFEFDKAERRKEKINQTLKINDEIKSDLKTDNNLVFSFINRFGKTIEYFQNVIYSRVHLQS